LIIAVGPLANIAFPGAGIVFGGVGSIGLLVGALFGNGSKTKDQLKIQDISNEVERINREILREQGSNLVFTIQQSLETDIASFGLASAMIAESRTKQT